MSMPYDFSSSHRPDADHVSKGAGHFGAQMPLSMTLPVDAIGCLHAAASQVVQWQAGVLDLCSPLCKPQQRRLKACASKQARTGHADDTLGRISFKTLHIQCGIKIDILLVQMLGGVKEMLGIVKMSSPLSRRTNRYVPVRLQSAMPDRHRHHCTEARQRRRRLISGHPRSAARPPSHSPQGPTSPV